MALPEINEQENWTAFNVDKANELLNDAGYKWKNKKERVNSDGSPIKFEILVVSGWSDWVRSAQVISQNLKKLVLKQLLELMTLELGLLECSKENFKWLLDGQIKVLHHTIFLKA